MNKYLVTITDEHGTTRRLAHYTGKYALEYQKILNEMIEDGIFDSASVEKLDKEKENETL